MNALIIHDRPSCATIAVAIAVLAAVCFVAFSPGAAGAAASALSFAGDGVGDPIAWGACDPPGVDLQCARIKVPLDWNEPNGRTISLALIRHLATKPAQRIGTLLFNPGGPGLSGVETLQGDPTGIDALGGGRFDVVSWDPRGTNASTRVQCFRNPRSEAIFWAGVSIPITNAESERFARKSVDLARRCGEVSGWLLPHISTADTARDLDHLRVLMGEEKLTYFGFSYGTYLGQTYANMFPDRIRAMLFSGLVDPTEYSKNAEARTTRLVASTDEVYDQFLSLCEGAGPERCALAGGDQTAAERFKRLSERLKRAPIPAPGASPPLLSPQELTYGDMLLSQGAAAQFPGTWPENAANLAAALRGDGSGLESAAAAFKQPAGWARLTTEAAISCADAPAQRSLSAWPQVIRRFENVSRLKGVIGWTLWAPCAAWPVRGEDNYRGPWTVTTPNPILLLSKRYDPNTGYANAVHVEQLLGNAVLLTVDGYGHDPDPLSACAEQAFADYLVHLITPPKGTFCESNHKPFDPDFGKPPNQE